ncbi:MAG: prolyl oligopeptidase family serine peptidase [Planctomycetota bacterium]
MSRTRRRPQPLASDRGSCRGSRSAGWLCLVGIVFLATAGCATTERPSDTGNERTAPPVEGGSVGETGAPVTVTFRDRTINLKPFLVGQPYSNLQPDIEHGQLFYFERTDEGNWLRRLPLGAEGTVDLASGDRISDVDWSTRSYWGSKWHAGQRRLFLTSDEANDEHMNVYALDPASGALEQITHNDYTYGWSISADGRKLAHLARSGETEPFNTCLRVLDLESGEEREYHCDEGGADRFTWSRPHFHGEDIVVRMQHDGQRVLSTLARISPDGTVSYLVPPRVARFEHGLVDGEVEPGAVIFYSAETGFSELYRCELDQLDEDGFPAVTKLTEFGEDLGSIELLDTSPPSILTVVRRPHESEVRLLSAKTGEEWAGTRFPARVSITAAHGDRAIISLGSLVTPFRFARMRAVAGENAWRLELEEFAGLDPMLRQEICHVVPERVTYPTFDLVYGGGNRELHAYYLAPKDPPKDPADRRVMITAFYGGSNSYRTEVNILAAAGISVFSPAVRGSDGFGAEFESLNDGDLGGDEIVDVIAAAEWLFREKGYLPHQIGVYGGSHGGYATLRCLTFPPSTNGRNAAFPFGFGWSHAGFSDILSFYESCNIPDWVVKEAGDPKREAGKLRERSPIHHVERLRAPVLLTHGENDWRVPVEESRRFVERARELGKDVTYVEFAGQGHGIRGVQHRKRYYQAVLEFLESLDDRGEE